MIQPGALLVLRVFFGLQLTLAAVRANYSAWTLRNIYDASILIVTKIVQSKSMNSTAVATTPNARSRRNRVTFESGLRLRIGALLEERDALQEEVRQLRAAVQIYTEVARRLQVNGPQRVA
jgi:hypothetical protein